jgi:hypothetical protein
MVVDRQLTKDESFTVYKGPVLASLRALRVYLRMIPQEQFEHHVTANKNDFADWIQRVFGDAQLSKRIRACKAREQMVWALDDLIADERIQEVVKGQEPAAAKYDDAPETVQYANPVALQNDAAFDAIKNELVARNEHISQKYEEVIRVLKEAVTDAVPQEIEKLTESLRNRYSELMARISETRKGGKDTLIPALVMRQFPAKLSFARATRDRKDFAIAGAVLDQAAFELQEVVERKEIDVKREVLALVQNAK